MKKIVETCGKTWHAWHTDQTQTSPPGTPMLMRGFTQNGQTNERRIAARGKRFDLSSAPRREKPADSRYLPIDPDADA